VRGDKELESTSAVLRDLSTLAAHQILSKSHGGTPTPFCILGGGGGGLWL
jgi:hypothetical protein